MKYSWPWHYPLPWLIFHSFFSLYNSSTHQTEQQRREIVEIISKEISLAFVSCLKGNRRLKTIVNYYMRNRSSKREHRNSISTGMCHIQNRRSKWEKKSWIWILNNLNISSHFAPNVSSPNTTYIITILSYILHIHFFFRQADIKGVSSRVRCT